MNRVFRLGLTVIAAIVGTAFAGTAMAIPLVVLPSGPVDGLGAQTYDQGTVYSVALLAEQQGAGLLPVSNGTYDFAVGSGTIPVLIYSNNGVANPAGFQTQMAAGAEGNFDGIWGVSNVGTIGLLRTMLTINGTEWQPLFVFDHNENQQSPNLLISGRVAVYRAGSELASFAFDTAANGAFDVNSRVTSCGEVTLGPDADTPYGACNLPAPTTSGTTYEWKTAGSGKPDYFAIFKDLDLYSGAYADSDSIVVEMSLRDMNRGFDELGIAGYLLSVPDIVVDVPEPGGLALLGIALAGLGAATRRRRTS